MTEQLEIKQTGCASYELEIPIQAPREAVWKALLEETNAWWLPDFHMVDPSSTVEFDVQPGGKGLIEYKPNGGFLAWCSVQMYLPDQFKIYLFGNIAPDWGGPSNSNLRLWVDEHKNGCVLKVSDTHHGTVTQPFVDSLKHGWTQLFTEGLKAFVESTA